MTAGYRKKRKRRGYSAKRHHGYYASAMTAAALRERVHGLTAAALRERVHGPTAAMLRARVHGLTAAYAESLHPRGKDGKWIEKFGDILVSGTGDKRIDGKRAKVLEITQGLNRGGKPHIVITKYADNGETEGRFIVNPENVSQAPARKGRLSGEGPAAMAEPVNIRNLRIFDEVELGGTIPRGWAGIDTMNLDGRRARVRRFEPGFDNPKENIVVTLLDDEGNPINQGIGADEHVKAENIVAVHPLGDRETLEAQIPTGTDEDAAALLDGLRRRVHEFEEAESARRWAEAEVSVIEPNPEAVAAADEADLDALRARVHAMERRSRQRAMARVA